MKKLVSVLLTMVLVFCSTTGAFAASKNDVQNLNTKKNTTIHETKIGDKDLIVSKVLSFDELVQVMAKNENISTQEAANIIISNKTKTMGIDQTSNLQAAQAAYTATYRTLTQQFTVDYLYRPTMSFYCETSESISTWGILKILNVGMNRNFNGTTKQFGGTVYYNLENCYTIFWIANGDFFNNGSTTVGGGIEIGIGESATINFTASYSTNHYAYCYQEARLVINY